MRHGAITGVLGALAAAAALSGCGSGGNGGSVQPGTSAFVAGSGTVGTGELQFMAPTGSAPNCQARFFLNSSIYFDFSAPVSPSSLPNFATGGQGPADGSIRIVSEKDDLGNQVLDPNTGQPAPPIAAIGSFSVIDRPGFPPGNQQRVVFAPVPPSNPAATCASGFFANRTYDVVLVQGPLQPSLVVGGQPLQIAATGCFKTCACDPLNGNSTAECGGIAFADPVPGAPFVISTTPAAGSPAPAPIDPASIVGNKISIHVSEPMKPVGINPANIIIRNAATGAQVPGTVAFIQTGTIPGLTTGSIIEYTTTQPLTKGVTYEIAFGTGVTDFGGNPLQTSPLGAGGPQLLFQTIAATTCPGSPFVEGFDSIANKAGESGAFVWNTSGTASVTYPLNEVGDGSDGAVTVSGVTATFFDTNQTITVGGNPVSRQGKWNFTSFTVNAGATARFHGPWQVHLRSQGIVTINGNVNANAGATTTPVVGQTWEQGAKPGVLNNGAGPPVSPNTVTAAAGNGGGGDGGKASNAESTNGGIAIRSNTGDDGQGPRVNGQPNTSVADASYAGGQGGDGGNFPQSFPGELGGLGGAGGTAATIGENGFPRTSVAAGCNPITTVTAPAYIAQARPVTSFWAMPISVQTGGSGGGGGGDKFETANIPNNDDQGGAGGAGGGSIRVSSVGTLTVGSAGVIACNGSQGAIGSSANQAGHGGSGSGGQIWLQTFSNLSLTATSGLQVIGPTRVQAGLAQGCSNAASGGGGQGLVQLEFGSGSAPTAFALSANAVQGTFPFPFATNVTGELLSNFFDTQSFNPDFTSITELKTTTPGAVLEISYEGAFETVTGGSPDLTTLKSTVGGVSGGAKITAANAATELDGYRYIRFRASVTYPSPPTTTPTTPLPSIDSITINFNKPCP
ncbi:MAG TPA: Ig-like domain-containing protein [Planctomycetota bacterium]|nr:Ig-like domain-containing protein [Planctomycetota bacterium]